MQIVYKASGIINQQNSKGDLHFSEPAIKILVFVVLLNRTIDNIIASAKNVKIETWFAKCLRLRA